MEEWLSLNREFAYSELASNLTKLKVREITQFIIDEFILSAKCYDLDDPGLAPRCETHLARGLSIIKEYKIYEESFRINGTIPRLVDIRNWFKRNRTNWTYAEN